MALHLPELVCHEPTAFPDFQEQFVTTGVPPSARPTPSTPASEMSTPSVGVVVLSLGAPGALTELLAGLVPACQEGGVALVVIRRGPPIGLPQMDAAGVRIVFGKPAETEGELRGRGIAELDSDIIVITTDTEPLTHDWNALLPRLAQMVQLREDEVVAAEWVSRLGSAGAPDPAA